MNIQLIKRYGYLLIWIIGFSLSLQFGITEAAAFELLKSTSPDRSSPVPLQDATVSGENIYVFVSPATGLSKVEFYLDAPTSGTPLQVENLNPWDFAGTGATAAVANPFNTGPLADGSHTIAARLTLSAGGTQEISATFTKGGGASAALVFNPSSVNFSAPQGSNPANQTVSLNTSNGSVASFSVTDNAPWLTVTPTSGTTPQNAVTLAVNTTGLAAGSYTAAVTATATSYTQAALTVNLTVTSTGTYGLNLSLAANRSNPAPLQNATVSGEDIYVFVSPETGVSKAEFYLDAPTSGTPRLVENNAPWDFNGTNTTTGLAKPFKTGPLAAGSHTIAAKLTTAGGIQIISATFTKGGGASATLVFNPTSVSFSAPEGSNPAPKSVSLNTGNGSVASFSVTDNAPWLTVTPASGTTPENALALAVDATGLAVGTYTATVTATATGYTAGTANVSLTITTLSGDTCPPISPLVCTEVTPTLPYTLQWDQDEGKVLDGNNVGTGFTMILPSTNGTGYTPPLINVVPSAGKLQLTTTSGIFKTTINTQDNALGIGIEASSQISVLETELIEIPTGTGKNEQAGLWYGLDEDNYHKLVILSTSSGTKIEHIQEKAGVTTTATTTTSPVINITSTSRLLLRLRVNPVTKTIAAQYSLNGAAPIALGTYPAPDAWFNFDQAGIDPLIGTRAFGGIFSTHRSGPNPMVYKFDRFSVLPEPLPPPTSTTNDLEFVRNSYGLFFPTAMVWAADNRLYVTNLFGQIHALTFGTNQQVIDDQLIPILGNRLPLGITEDPNSTASNVILWVGHSNASTSNGQANSSTISRISQSVAGSSNFDTIQHVITGLPRAISEHAVNGIHFGADGRLYIAMGGNTGAGAPNTTTTEFGRRPEQPLSNAFVVADVNAQGFQGICGIPGCNAGPTASCPSGSSSWVNDSTGTADNTIPATCDVQLYSTGLRNMYDFVPHSNGNFYGPNNGLGVLGSFPPQPAPPCTGFASTATVANGGQNPGNQPDDLNLLIEGKYYGSPNPQRNECVFKDGSLQGVSPLPNYEPPILDLGDHKSANGIVEYPSNVGCVAMQGNMLITNYSQGDDVTRVVLSPNGATVAGSSSLAGGFSDPLPIAIGAGGIIFVGETGGNGKITSLQPFSLGCWSDKAPLPGAILDAGGTAIGNKLYVVAGKTATAHQSKMYIYDSTANTWSQGPDLPGVGVENPAVAVLNGKLYVFGGATNPFTGAVKNAAVFDPANAAAGWQVLALMPTARSGATAQALGGLIYVMGGMDTTGGSLSTVEIYNPGTNTWATGPSLGSLRDNPGSAVLGGKIYVFGGRIRNSNGTTVNGTLNTVEMYDPATGLWTARASMPTGRRTMVVGTLRGRAQVMGGEIMPDGNAFPQNEEYNPVTDTWKTLTPMSIPRHGAVAGTIGDTVYVTGGGPTGGSAFTNNTSAYKF